MNNDVPFLLREQPFSEAIVWVEQQVSNIGLQLLQTFDLQVARQAREECPCPHHGTARCDCQMGVLLIYGSQGQPISLVFHSYEGQTWLSIVDTPQQRADPGLEAMVRQALAPQSPGLDTSPDCPPQSQGTPIT